MGTLGARSGGQEVGAQTRGVGLRPASALGFHMTQDPISAGVSPALGGTTGGMAVLLRNREGKPGGGKGPLLSEERSLTRASANDQVLFTRPVVAPTFSAGAHPGGANGQDAPQVAAAILAAAQGVGIPRRLMPIETDRLMGWPDGHTAYGVAEDGTRYTLSDTARYRLCGNGVSSPVAAWIGWRLRWALEAATPTTLTPESRSCPV